MALCEARTKASAWRGVIQHGKVGDPVGGVCTQVVGSLADRKARPGKPLAGLLVQQGQSCMLMAPEDLPTFTMLHPGRIIQRQVLSLNQPWNEVRQYCDAHSLFLMGLLLHAVLACAYQRTQPPLLNTLCNSAGGTGTEFWR